MKNDIISSFISNHLRSVERHLSEFKKDKETEHLHHLRVDLKKVKAIFSFIDSIYEKKMDVNSLKLLFKNAGEIREFEINIAILSQLSHPPQEFIDELKRNGDALEQKFLNDISRFKQLVKKFRTESEISFHMPGIRVVRKYMNHKRKKASDRFNTHQRIKMHSFRKLLKKIMYVFELLPKKTQIDLKLNIELINKLQKEVGAWHDTYAAIAFLSVNDFTKKTEYISILNQKEKYQFNKLLITYPSLVV